MVGGRVERCRDKRDHDVGMAGAIDFSIDHKMATNKPISKKNTAMESSCRAGQVGASVKLKKSMARALEPNKRIVWPIEFRVWPLSPTHYFSLQ
jgi:hypothetical protein